MRYTIAEFEVLYTRCFTPAMRLAIGYLHDVDEARDTVHEVFARIWESHIIIDNPQAYIIRAVRNTCISRINARSAREKILQKFALEQPPDDYDIEQRHDEVKSAIQRLLTTRERQVVDKIYSEGLSYKQSAQSLGVSEATINKNIVSSLKKLRTFFKTVKS